MQKQARRKSRGLSNTQRRAWWGRLFILPWVIGVLWFFVIPMIQTAYYSVNTISVSASGLQFKFVGLDNYLYYFTTDPNFVPYLVSSLKSLVTSIPLIVCFSMFVAVILSGKFRGRTFFRAVFFFPVIIASGVVLNILTENLLMSTSGTTENQPTYMFQAPDLTLLFGALGVPDKVLDFISNIISRVFDLTWSSGVQILLMLAALGGIPSSLYEVADIEGATAWEKFWKITLPTVMPTLLVSIIYTVIDSFTDVGNNVMKMISSCFANGRYDSASAIGIVYFLCIMAMVGVISAFMVRYVNYAAD